MAAHGPVAIVLAAGKSTRMKSDRPKVLHTVCGRPMIEYVLDAVRSAGIARTLVVVGHGADAVRAALQDRPGVEFVYQAEQKGTGHAVMVCGDALAGHRGAVVVLYGDTPLVRSESIARLLAERNHRDAACLIASALQPDPTGYGRIVRDEAGRFLRIVEQRDASADEAAIREVNSGVYAFDGTALAEALAHLRPNNVQGELYLTDCPAILHAAGKTVLALPLLEPDEMLGVNTREQLAAAAEAMRRRSGGA